MFMINVTVMRTGIRLLRFDNEGIVRHHIGIVLTIVIKCSAD